MTSWGEKEADVANNMFISHDNSLENPYILRVGEQLDVSVSISDKNGKITVKKADGGSNQPNIMRVPGTNNTFDNEDSPTRMNAHFIGKQPGECYICYLPDAQQWGNESDRFYVKVEYPIYVQTAQGEIEKDRLHEYLVETYYGECADETYTKYIYDENGKRLYWQNADSNGGKYLIYNGDEITVVTYALAGENVTFEGDAHMIKQSSEVRTDVGNGFERISAVFKGSMDFKKGAGTITLCKDGAPQGQYLYCYIVNDARSCSHADNEIADGGSYVERTFVRNPDGSAEEIVTVYDAYVDNVNKCIIYDKNKNVLQTFYTEHYYRGGNPGETQYELTSNYILAPPGDTGGIHLENGDVVNLRTDKYFPLSDADTVLFDVQLLLIPKTETVTKYDGDTITDVTVNDISDRETVPLPSIKFDMDHTSVIDAYNKCPNHKYVGDNEPDETGDKDVVGKTPDVVTKVYTTGISVIKVDADDTAKTLTGAKFRIEGKSLNRVAVSGKICKEDASGTYTEADPDDPDVDETKYKSTETKYKLVDSEISDSKASGETKVFEAVVDEDGFLTFEGLGAGSYTLTEIVAPKGYNKSNDEIKIVITDEATKSAPNWKVNGEDATPDAKGIIKSFTVKNNKGITLPGTGGIGTVIFYVVGTLCVAAGVTMTVAKKKNGAAKN